MARGQRKSIDEKIAAKEEILNALLSKVEAEKKELEEMYREKREKELETVSQVIEDSGLAPDEVADLIRQYLESREEAS